MAKKKKKKREPSIDSLGYIYEVGDQLEVKYVMHDDDGNPEVTKTPVRVTHVGDGMMGVDIIGKRWGRRFVKGFVIEIENDRFRIVSERKTAAVLEYLEEDIL
jgi:hypothetical protein